MKHKVQIVGVLNTTPDSYWDGGQYVTPSAAVRRVGALIAEGADIIEVGGESTGPGSDDVLLSTELARTIPIIQAIKHSYPEVRLSIDTYKSEVAQAALEAGAEMVNDVTAGRANPEILSVVAKYEAQLVLMYAKDNSPRTTKAAVKYHDVVGAIGEFLKERTNVAIATGIKSERIIIDPGLGHFVSSESLYSFQIIARLHEFLERGFPVFVSPSRKSFLVGAENLSTKDRLPGTIAASVIAVTHGASYIRTHDVAAVRRGCEIAATILRLRRDW